MAKNYLTVKQVAELLEINPKSVYNLIHRISNPIPYVYKNGVGYRFLKEDVYKWLEAGKCLNYDYKKSLKNLTKTVVSSTKKDDICIGGAKRMRKKLKGYGDGFVRQRKKDGKKINRWDMIYYDNGRRIQKVVKGAKGEHDAWVELQRINEELYNKRNGIEQPKETITFKELSKIYLDDYAINKRSGDTDRRYIELHLNPHFGQMNLTQITPHDVNKYVNIRKSEQAKGQTINLELSVLRTIWNVGLRSKKFLMNENPVSTKEHFQDNSDSIRDRVLTVDEEPKLLKELPPHQVPIVQVALNTGMRKQELLKLEISHVDFKNRKIKIIALNNKSKRDDVIPMNSFVVEIFKQLIKENSGRSKFMFNHKNGKYGRINYIDHGFSKALEKAGIKEFQFRDLRRTFGTRMAKLGTNPFVLQKLMRHSDIKTTMEHYVQVDSKDMLDAAELLCQSGKSQKQWNKSGISKAVEIPQTSKPAYLQ